MSCVGINPVGPSGVWGSGDGAKIYEIRHI